MELACCYRWVFVAMQGKSSGVKTTQSLFCAEIHLNRTQPTHSPSFLHLKPPQGRNDVRDAKADVTDMRAPSKTQKVRSMNRAFDLDEENEVTIFETLFLLDLTFLFRPY